MPSLGYTGGIIGGILGGLTRLHLERAPVRTAKSLLREAQKDQFISQSQIQKLTENLQLAKKQSHSGKTLFKGFRDAIIGAGLGTLTGHTIDQSLGSQASRTFASASSHTTPSVATPLVTPSAATAVSEVAGPTNEFPTNFLGLPKEQYFRPKGTLGIQYSDGTTRPIQSIYTTEHPGDAIDRTIRLESTDPDLARFFRTDNPSSAIHLKWCEVPPQNSKDFGVQGTVWLEHDITEQMFIPPSSPEIERAMLQLLVKQSQHRGFEGRVYANTRPEEIERFKGLGFERLSPEPNSTMMKLSQQRIQELLDDPTPILTTISKNSPDEWPPTISKTPGIEQQLSHQGLNGKPNQLSIVPDINGNLIVHNHSGDMIRINRQPVKVGQILQMNDEVHLGNEVYTVTNDGLALLSKDAQTFYEFWPQGLREMKYEQGNLPDCYFLARTHSLWQTLDGKRAFANMIQKDAQGNPVIIFPGLLNHSIPVQRVPQKGYLMYPSARHPDTIVGSNTPRGVTSTSHPGIVMIEEAFFKLPEVLKIPHDKTKQETWEFLAGGGTGIFNSDNLVQLLTGKQTQRKIIELSPGVPLTDEQRQSLQKLSVERDNLIVEASIPKITNPVKATKLNFQTLTRKTVFPANHTYSIQIIGKQAKITNPWFTQRTYTIPIKDLPKYGFKEIRYE